MIAKLVSFLLVLSAVGCSAAPAEVEEAPPAEAVEGTAPQGEDAAPVTPAAISDTVINSSERITMGWDAWGYDYTVIAGRGCDAGWTRTSHEAYRIEGRGVCFVEGWASQSPYDCRVVVRLRQRARKSGTCIVNVYRWGQTVDAPGP